MAGINYLLFDWGDTIMRDFMLPGPMYNWDKVEWIPGAEKSLRELSERFICIIATNADHSGSDGMKMALNRVGADQYFKHFYASSEMGYSKPDPAFFIYIADQLGAKPEEIIMTGNLYEKDIVGAKKAGLKTVFFNEEKLPGEYPMADKVIYFMHNLIAAIDEIVTSTK